VQIRCGSGVRRRQMADGLEGCGRKLADIATFMAHPLVGSLDVLRKRARIAPKGRRACGAGQRLRRGPGSFPSVPWPC
jgi:hypothetical protein